MHVLDPHGLGHIGKTVAETFVALRFTVLGWSRSLAQIPGVSCFCGQEGLDSLLPQVDYLVCLLPLTAETKNILNKTSIYSESQLSNL